MLLTNLHEKHNETNTFCKWIFFYFADVTKRLTIRCKTSPDQKINFTQSTVAYKKSGPNLNQLKRNVFYTNRKNYVYWIQ